MNSITLTENIQVSNIECKEYFPLRVIFDSSVGGNRFVGFYGGDSNLLEFTVNSNTNAILKLQVVTCNNFEFLETNLLLPHPEKSGCVHLKNPQRNNCDTFSLTVYADGISIKISSASAGKYYAMGQVIFGVSDDNELVSLAITKLSADAISHTKSELLAEQMN